MAGFENQSEQLGEEEILDPSRKNHNNSGEPACPNLCSHQTETVTFTEVAV
jgi:hypothetical protein